jgi:hypothetical protein
MAQAPTSLSLCVGTMLSSCIHRVPWPRAIKVHVSIQTRHQGSYFARPFHIFHESDSYTAINMLFKYSLYFYKADIGPLKSPRDTSEEMDSTQVSRCGSKLRSTHVM